MRSQNLDMKIPSMEDMHIGMVINGMIPVFSSKTASIKREVKKQKHGVITVGEVS
jgi:hypothetical protein